jgi:hypothetical protein
MDIPIHLQVTRYPALDPALELTPRCSLDLLRSFYSEGLVDNRTFLTWLVLQMCTCNLAQAGFLARLADEYLDGIIACRALSRPFVDACLSKISEVRIMMTFCYWLQLTDV